MKKRRTVAKTSKEPNGYLVAGTGFLMLIGCMAIYFLELDYQSVIPVFAVIGITFIAVGLYTASGKK